LVRQFQAIFAFQHGDQLRTGGQQIAHVIGSIAQLVVGEVAGIAPVGALGSFVEFDADGFFDQVFETVARAVGAGEFAGDLGAEERLDIDAQVMLQGGDVEAGEVEDFGNIRGFEELFQMWGGGLALGDADDADPIVLVADLHQAKPIAQGQESHGFRIHRQGSGGLVGGKAIGTQVAVKNLKILAIHGDHGLQVVWLIQNNTIPVRVGDIDFLTVAAVLDPLGHGIV
jgi:hypothetical protein